MTTDFDALVQWYAAHCDGEWEHTYGIKLNTLDNPGWSLTVGLADTELERIPFDLVEHQQDQSWWRCWRDDAAFHAACSVSNVGTVLNIFIVWANAVPPSTRR